MLNWLKESNRTDLRKINLGMIAAGPSLLVAAAAAEVASGRGRVALATTM